MTSGIQINQIISTSLFIEQLKRFWPMMLLCLVAYLLFVTMPIYSSGDSYVAANAMIELLSMGNALLLTATILIPFATVMMLFSYLFDPQGTNFLGFGENLNKSRMFCTNVLTGLVLMIIPILFMCLLLFIWVHYPDSGDVINTVSVVIAFAIRLIISYIFYFAIFLLAICLSGTRLMAALLALVLPLIPTIFYRFIRLIPAIYVFGYDSPSAPLPADILNYSNPIAWFWESIIIGIVYVFGLANIERSAPDLVLGMTNPLVWHWFWDNRSIAFVLIYIFITLLTFVGGYFCFIKRRAEQNGEPLVFTPFRHVLLFLASVTGMISMGGFFLNITGNRWFMYYGFVLGLAFGFCVTQMIFERSFNILHRIRWIIPSALAAGIIYGIVIVITSFGMRFYTHSVPGLHEVAGVFVGTSRWENGMAFVGDDESLTQAITLHRYILDNQSEVRQVFWQSLNDDGEHLFFAYRLTNGSMIFRRYPVTEDFIVRSGADYFMTFDFTSPPQPDLAYALPESPETIEASETTELPEYEATDLTPSGSLPSAPVVDNPDMIDFIHLRFVGLPGNEEFTISEPSQVELLIGALNRDYEADLLRQQENGEYGDSQDYMVEVYIGIKDYYREIYSNVRFNLVQIDYTIALIQTYAEQEVTA